MKQYLFRQHTIHVHPSLNVFIGNDEVEMVLYSKEPDFTLLALLRWLPDKNSIRIINRWKLTYEYDGNNNIYIHYDSDYRY
ncbi:TPA: hypothetical protein U1058_000898 [Streptococcus suis]|nr:hypothetical protein [Streptococcus suis]